MGLFAMEVFKSIFSDPLVGGINLFLTLLAIALAFIFYRKGRLLKKPLFCCKGVTVFRSITDRVPNLNVSYSGINVDNLSMTKLLFWNGGSGTINLADVAEADPITLRTSGDARLLNIDVVHVDNKANKLGITNIDEDSSAKIFFDFMEKK